MHCNFIIETFHNLDEVAVIDEIQLLKDPERGWAMSIWHGHEHFCNTTGVIECDG